MFVDSYMKFEDLLILCFTQNKPDCFEFITEVWSKNAENRKMVDL